jgi:hypothetical protein
MDEQTEATAPAPKKTVKRKRKPRHPPRRASFQKPVAASEVEYPGLTETVCAAACNVNGCVISGNAMCAHPNKGGLRGPDMYDPEAVKRLQLAKKQLASASAEKRFS